MEEADVLLCVILQRKAQTQQTREFQKKSIKEKGAHLRGLFSGDTAAEVKSCSVKRSFPQSGDKCHSCEKRVYMVERVCAEGLYFHKECFRCSTCSSALRQGAHAFDSQHGRLYCKLHFDQRNNGTNLRRSVSLRSMSPSQTSNGFHLQERHVPDKEGSQSSSSSSSTAEPQSEPAAGTFSTFIRKQLSWPLSVSRTVCNAPWRLSRYARRTTQALAGHLRANAQDYTFLYELLSMSLPLLVVLQEVLLQIHTDAVPYGPGSVQTLLLWLQEHVDNMLI